MTKRKFGGFAELKQKTDGQWPWILADLAPELAPALARPGRHVACPMHGGQNGFRLFSDFAHTGGGICNTCGAFPTGFKLLAWLRGYSNRDAVRDVGRWVDNEEVRADVAPRMPPAPERPSDAKVARMRKRVWSVWHKSRPLRGSVAETYLVKRGIPSGALSWTLRFHPGLEYLDEDGKHWGTFPALVAPLTDGEGRIVSVHRTFLSPDGGKAPVPEVKKVLPGFKTLRGCAIKLWPAGGTLALTEGIETALAVRAATRLPVWAAYSSTLLPNVQLPPTVRKVLVFADKDVSGAGQLYADKAAKSFRALGLEAEVLLPDMDIAPGAKTVDWLDVFVAQGAQGFPCRWRGQAQAATPQAVPLAA